MAKKSAKQKVKVSKVVPQNEIIKIEKENKPVINKAVALTIKIARDETAAYEVLKQIASRKKVIESKRKEITQPLNISLKAANTLFKELSSPLNEADGIIRDKIMEFREKRESQAAAREKKLCLQAEEAEEDGDEELVEKLEDKIELVAPRVGESSTVKRWTFEVEDIHKIPREYLLVDQVEINRAIRNGARDIKGIRIFQKESVRV